MEEHYHSASNPAPYEPSSSTHQLPKNRIAAHGGLGVATLVLAAFALLGLKTPDSASTQSGHTSIQAAADSSVALTPTSTFEIPKDIPKDIAEDLHRMTSKALAAIETGDLRTEVPLQRSDAWEGLSEGDWPREVGEYRLVRQVSHEHRAHYSHVDKPNSRAFLVRNRPGNMDFVSQETPPKPGSDIRHVGDAVCYDPQNVFVDEGVACFYEHGKRVHHIVGVGEFSQVDTIIDFMQQLRAAYPPAN